MAAINPLLLSLPSLPCIRSSPVPRASYRPHNGTIVASATVSPVRRSANYQRTLWSDDFIQSLPTTSQMDARRRERLVTLKEEVRRELGSVKDVAEVVETVDVLQQLGLGQLFENEIKDSLEYVSENRGEILLKGDLHSTSLLFRVLRENGFDISQDVFEEYMNRGHLKSSCKIHGINRILSLYEASFYAHEGEKLLDDAREFTVDCLKDASVELPSTISEKVKYALDLPIHRRLQWSHAHWFIDAYSKHDYLNPKILELARLNFHITQVVHKEDVKKISRWWTNLGIIKHLPFSRDRIVETFLWTVGMFPQPQYSIFRIRITQIIAFIILMDDIYDVYGTIEELETFTGVVNRWDMKAADQLPEYMKICFHSIYNLDKEITSSDIKDKGANIAIYTQKAWAILSTAYMQEAKWYHEQYVPSMDQYTRNAAITIATPLIMIHVYAILCKELSLEILESWYDYSNFILSTAVINRLVDDLATSDDELKRGDVHKSIQCYMHHEDASKQASIEEVDSIIMKYWKKVNKERYDGLLPKLLIDAALNHSRSCHNVYKHGDGYGAPDQETTNHIKSMFFSPNFI